LSGFNKPHTHKYHEKSLFHLASWHATCWGGNLAIGQSKFVPKYLRENNKAFTELATRATADGWIEFRQDGKQKIDPATFFERFGSTLGFDKDYSVKLVKDKADVMKNRHQHYQLYYKGIRVEGADYTIHSRDGALTVVHGRIPDGLNLDISKPVAEKLALEAALADQNLTGADVKGKDQLPKGTLIFVSTTDEVLPDNIRLAYTFEINLNRIYVDATSGKIIKRVPLVQSCFGDIHDSHLPVGHIPPKSTATANLVDAPLVAGTFTYRKLNPSIERTQTFETGANPGGGFRLTASSPNATVALETRFDRDNNNITFGRDAAGQQVITGVTYDLNDPIPTNSANSWGLDPDGTRTAHWVAYRAFEYFRDRRIYGLDDNGSIAQISVAPVIENNAFFNPTSTGGQLFFGRALTTNRSLATVDITAHEYGHGISRLLTTGLAGRGLRENGQARALDEGFSDIFGTALERQLIPEWNWTVGEDLGVPLFIRNMADPNSSGRPQPTTFQGSNWDFGVNTSGHTNSGVLSRWFFLVEGDPQVSFDNAIQIVIRALDVDLNNGSSNFEDARNATIHATQDLFGGCSPQEKAVIAAWRTVGVTNNLPSSRCTPTCDFELATAASVNATCNQAVTFNINCNGIGVGACDNMNYLLFDPETERIGYTPTVTITAPSVGGSYRYSARIGKANCYYPEQVITLNVNCAAPIGACDAFTVGTVVGYGSNNPSLGVMVGFDGTCKRAMWANGSGLTPVDWKPYVVPTGNFTTASINQCLRYGGEACGGGTNPNPTTRCAAFTNGREVASWTGGDPGYFTVRVRDNPNCRQAIWGNGDPVLTDWKPYLTAKPGFNIEDVFYCLNFDGNCNNGSPASVRPAPAPATAFAVGNRLNGQADESPARVSSGEAAAGSDELVAYPNPTSDVLTVNLGYVLPANPTVTLTDVLGRTHETASRLSVTGGQRIKLSVRHLPTGIYVLRIGGEGIRPRTVRFVKE
jgi:bacillolysin